jgi:hypothetical protein
MKTFTGHIAYPLALPIVRTPTEAEAQIPELTAKASVRLALAYFGGKLGLKTYVAVRNYYQIDQFAPCVHIEWPGLTQAEVYADPRWMAWKALTDLAPMWLGNPEPEAHAEMIATLAGKGEITVDGHRWDIRGNYTPSA